MCEWICGDPPQCGIQASLWCFRDHTTWVPSKKARTLSLKRGNASVIPLVLQQNVGGGDHLTPGDPPARLSYFSIKKIIIVKLVG
ncbi:unnamed protein product [Leptidea sinapis]|uniref:Uncharacterized protein n=1 Tax=Leptidea sinapis TaxID=189913 RepID=A0A5E4PZ09_9NEOP|nr:unnamed protein product [Leptidea sinapis]